jgi:hypothetical protein
MLHWLERKHPPTVQNNQTKLDVLRSYKVLCIQLSPWFVTGVPLPSLFMHPSHTLLMADLKSRTKMSHKGTREGRAAEQCHDSSLRGLNRPQTAVQHVPLKQISFVSDKRPPPRVSRQLAIFIRANLSIATSGPSLQNRGQSHRL